MIELKRSRKPQDVPPSLCGHKLIEKEQELIDSVMKVRSGTLKKVEFKDSYWGKAKAQLKKESFNKCAYCESPTAVVAHGDVEHYRPKSVYWWLAYCYDNYLFSCQICNQAYKSDKFPVSANLLTEPDITSILAGKLAIDPLAQATLHTTFQQQLAAEKADLPNPYYEDPSPYFIWEADDVLKEVVIAPNPAHPDAARVFKAVNDCLGLNRTELKLLRYQVFKNFKIVKLTSQQADRFSDDLIQMAIDRIAEMKDSREPYAGMVRFFDSIM